MVNKRLAIFLTLAVILAFSLAIAAAETVKGKIDVLDKEAKKITISGTEYSLSDEAAQTDVAVGDEVEATVEDGIIKDLMK